MKSDNVQIRETHRPDHDGYRPGDYWMVCDVCGLDYRRSEMRQRWDRAWVCRDDWEIKHPQESVRGIRERIRVPVARPVPANNNLISSWSNGTYETFSSTGSHITSAIDTSGGGQAVSNNTGIVNGTQYKAVAILARTSGEYPSLVTGSASVADGDTLAQLSETNGVNEFNFTAGSKPYIWVTNTTDANWSLVITLTKIVSQDDL